MVVRENVMRSRTWIGAAAAAGLTTVAAAGLAAAQQGDSVQGPNAKQAQPEKMKTGQANQPAEAPKGVTRGQGPANENRASQTGAPQMENKQQNSQASGERHVNPQNVRAEGNAHLTNERAARVADTLLATATTQNVNAKLAVGEPLPGDLRLLPLPPTIVSLVPEYREYEYVVVNDEIAIVQPSTRHVVEIINPGGP